MSMQYLLSSTMAITLLKWLAAFLSAVVIALSCCIGIVMIIIIETLGVPEWRQAYIVDTSHPGHHNSVLTIVNER